MLYDHETPLRAVGSPIQRWPSAQKCHDMRQLAIHHRRYSFQVRFLCLDMIFISLLGR